ncbi:leucine-rich repeat extensin-like protein 3 [Arachis duranensis]|uniref:Leucine-rich repeat extensin-like protein 3 n=1 Tax=Arachis duranensis TaxID=130453 RepID=A0A6P4C5S6_ARADU|nr:leucine-rich repeat extensin-like protein 3 [Arachis duranensis]
MQPPSTANLHQPATTTTALTTYNHPDHPATLSLSLLPFFSSLSPTPSAIIPYPSPNHRTTSTAPPPNSDHHHSPIPSPPSSPFPPSPYTSPTNIALHHCPFRTTTVPPPYSHQRHYSPICLKFWSYRHQVPPYTDFSIIRS